MASDNLHESADVLPPEAIDRHRAISSIMEELEAVDWYDQRVHAASDPELAAILAHNRDEEKEHAAMTLEWLRRHDAKLDEHLRTYLFTDEPVLRIEEQDTGRPPLNHLDRHLAPLSAAAWEAVEDAVKGHMSTHLVARRLVDLEGPHGWDFTSTTLGRTSPVKLNGEGGVDARQRRVVAVVELRAPFKVSRAELEHAERGAEDLDLADLDRAAREIALVENRALFQGISDTGIEGIGPASPHDPMPLGDDYEAYPRVVAAAVNRLRLAGVAGPYSLALGPDAYTGVVETTEEGGLVVLDHLHQILGDSVVWAPGVVGGLVLSMRGGDFVIDVGQDLAIGYRSHDSDSVELYLEESFTFRVNDGAAAIVLTP